MNRKQLIKNIYILTYPEDLIGKNYTLNIYRGKYTLKEAWNTFNGLLVSKLDKYGNEIFKYVDDLTIFDQIFIYRKLLRLDIYKKMKNSYPDKTKKEVYDLTMQIFKNLINPKKIIHRN